MFTENVGTGLSKKEEFKEPNLKVFLPSLEDVIEDIKLITHWILL